MQTARPEWAGQPTPAMELVAVTAAIEGLAYNISEGIGDAAKSAGLIREFCAKLLELEPHITGATWPKTAADDVGAAAVYTIDGLRFQDLNGFYDEIERVFLPPDCQWGRNLDALYDVLRGGFGTPAGGFTLGGFTLVWKNASASRGWLGYEETVRRLELRLQRCHPENRERVRNELSAAQAGTGPTVFDWLSEIIREHPQIKLRLE